MDKLFIMGDNYRLARNPNWPDRICDQHTITHIDGNTEIQLVNGGIVTTRPLYSYSELPNDFVPERLIPKIGSVEAYQLFNAMATQSALTNQRIGQLLSDYLSAHSHVINVDGHWYLSDLVTVLDEFYYEDDIEIVQLKFFQQFVV